MRWLLASKKKEAAKTVRKTAIPYFFFYFSFNYNLFSHRPQFKSTKMSRQEMVNNSDEEVNEQVTLIFQSDRTVENKKDDLATSTVQMDTEFDKDARTIFENSLPSKPLVHIQVFLSPE